MDKFLVNKRESVYEITNPCKKEVKSKSSSISLFLDRDGVIIRDTGYISNPKEVVLEKGIKVLLNKAWNYGIKVFIVTNQSGISRGFYDWNDFEKVNERMLNLIGNCSPIIAIYANSHIHLTKHK